MNYYYYVITDSRLLVIMQSSRMLVFRTLALIILCDSEGGADIGIDLYA